MGNNFPLDEDDIEEIMGAFSNHTSMPSKKLIEGLARASGLRNKMIKDIYNEKSNGSYDNPMPIDILKT